MVLTVSERALGNGSHHRDSVMFVMTKCLKETLLQHCGWLGGTETGRAYNTCTLL